MLYAEEAGANVGLVEPDGFKQAVGRGFLEGMSE